MVPVPKLKLSKAALFLLYLPRHEMGTVGIIILNIFPVDFNVKTIFFLLSITLL